MFERPSYAWILAGLLLIVPLAPHAANAGNSPRGITESAGGSPPPAPLPGAPGGPSPATAPPPDAADNESNAAKARALVAAAINMTDSAQAVKLLWQATDLDPTYDDAYIYLALFYNSRSNFGKVIEVYQKLLKYQPREASAYLNMGEAYMSFSPPRMNEALPNYQKALQIDPTSSFAELRIGQIYAAQGNREAALRYLKLASGDRAKNPDIANQADRLIHDIMGS
jgi:tetratricopeptide (TPR) repeat protein